MLPLNPPEKARLRETSSSPQLIGGLGGIERTVPHASQEAIDYFCENRAFYENIQRFPPFVRYTLAGFPARTTRFSAFEASSFNGRY